MQGKWAILAEKCQACKMLSRLNKKAQFIRTAVFIENQKV